MTSSTAAFRAARDLLLARRSDYSAARREFTWPDLDEFNWALDWFDVIAAEHPGQEALRVVTEDSTTTLTYGELAARSSGLSRVLAGMITTPSLIAARMTSHSGAMLPSMSSSRSPRRAPTSTSDRCSSKATPPRSR